MVEARREILELDESRICRTKIGVSDRHRGEPIGVPMQDGQIVEWIGARKLTRVDQTHEQIANASTTLGFIEQRISAMQNRFFQGPLDNGAVEWGAGHA